MYRVNVCHITEIGNKFSRKCCGVVYVLYEPVASVIAIYYISRRTVDLVVIAFRCADDGFTGKDVFTFCHDVDCHLIGLDFSDFVFHGISALSIGFESIACHCTTGNYPFCCLIRRKRISFSILVDHRDCEVIIGIYVSCCSVGCNFNVAEFCRSKRRVAVNLQFADFHAIACGSPCGVYFHITCFYSLILHKPVVTVLHSCAVGKCKCFCRFAPNRVVGRERNGVISRRSSFPISMHAIHIVFFTKIHHDFSVIHPRVAFSFFRICWLIGNPHRVLIAIHSILRVLRTFGARNDCLAQSKVCAFSNNIDCDSVACDIA